jgi:hypothetical protein
VNRTIRELREDSGEQRSGIADAFGVTLQQVTE